MLWMMEEETSIVPISELKVGDIVLIRSGGKIPADGVVVEGKSDVNEAMMTGESKPVEKRLEKKSSQARSMVMVHWR